MLQKNSKTCRALDLGFGFTKFSTGHYESDGTLSLGAFPSYAAPTVTNLIGGNVLTQLSVLTVEVGNETFTVGEHVRHAADGVARQMLETTFFKSSQYIALARGAMALMNIPADGTIDTLVLGLPLNVFRDESIVTHVERILSGNHPVPDPSNPQGTKRILTVKNLHVIPQVVGSLIAMTRETTGLAKKLKEQQNLTIDVGYGTLLWLVSDGLMPVVARSNGNMGGVSSLLQKVIRAIDPQAVSNMNILDRLDKALRENDVSILVNGQEVFLAKYHSLLASAVSENLTELIRSIGTSQDIDNVFLTGGGAHLYLGALQKAFPNRTINISGNASRYNNVRGFQHLSENDE